MTRSPGDTLLGVVPWLFLIAYTCSGIAGLVYEVSWTRLLTLYIGHTTAAAAAVVAAFLGGLAAGAAWGGDMASRLSRASALRAYVGLELGVAVAALLARQPHPTDQDVDDAITNICRCGTFARVRRAIRDLARS